MAKIACVACSHEIDSAAKICPYCGSDPQSGQKIVDTSALLQEMFQPRRLSASESLLEYARHRQGIVIAVSAAVLFVVLAALHQFVTIRNESAVSSAPAVPLTEVADLSNEQDETKPAPMPELNFQYDGNPNSMRTFIVEPGAVTPPEVVAAQQQAAAAQQQAHGAPGQPAPAQPQPLKPGALQQPPRAGAQMRATTTTAQNQ